MKAREEIAQASPDHGIGDEEEMLKGALKGIVGMGLEKEDEVSEKKQG